MDLMVEKTKAQAVDTDDVPLCVDLDGSLIRTDLLAESMLRFIKANPLHVFQMIIWLLKGKACLKAELAKRVVINPAALPYNEDVLAYIKKQNRKIVLVTGSNRIYADAVAGHLQLFDQVLASDDSINLTKSNKKDRLVKTFGEKGFDYIGDDPDDWQVWPAARHALVVARQGRFLEKTRTRFSPASEFILPSMSFRDFIKAIRVHQWAKNFLIFVPFVLEHRFDDLLSIYQLVLSFICLSFLASLTYIINDLFDLESDRQNRTKRLRAFASGLIPIKHAVVIMGGLFLIMMILLLQLNTPFRIVLGIYLLTTLSYSLFFKSVAMLDVCILAGLYTLRVIGGGVVIEAEWSFWLLAFSMFFFLSLALVKRVSELENLRQDNRKSSNGRGYLVSDLPVLVGAGIGSGLLSILVVALYINADKVVQMYEFPQILWLICPLLLYWIGRMWLITTRGDMHEDPILFAIRDRVSLITAVLAAMVVGSAIFFKSPL